MISRITAIPKTYDWGSRVAIPQILGTTPTDEPQAELWLGAHPGSITTLVNPPADAAASTTLQDWLVAQDSGSNRESRLPFLLKILAAERPLSLQAHPSLADARTGYATETDAGLLKGDPRRNYKDEWHKPELIVALEDGFQALCGFRTIIESQKLLHALAASANGTSAAGTLTQLAHDLETEGLAAQVRTILTEPSEHVVDAIATATSFPPVPEWAAEWALLELLATLHPNDPGVAIAALMNFVTLRRDEALFLAAGNIHAYVKGVGVEMMAASDNVLRGGLTSKHVDTSELLHVLDFTAIEPDVLRPTTNRDGSAEYVVPVPDFRLLRVRGRAVELALPRHSIAIVASGTAHLETRGERLELRQGESVFITAGESVHANVSGTMFIGSSDM